MRSMQPAKLLAAAAVLIGVGEAIFGIAFGRSTGTTLCFLALSLILTVIYIWILLRGQSGSPGSEPAGLWDRLWAFFADYMIAGGIFWPLAAFLTAIHEDWPKELLVTSIILTTYFFLPQYLVSRSPGSILQGIGLKYDSVEDPSFLRALGRVLLSYVALGLWIVSVPMASSDSGKRMWQDKVFGTRVVQWTD
ncbi:MAG TPA: RDD family protein [Gammaproteobacteria bacterium]